MSFGLGISLLLALCALCGFRQAYGWSFSLPPAPAQCQPLELQITGGVNPYTFTFLQFPPSSSPNATNSSLWTSATGRASILSLELPSPVSSSSAPVVESVILPFTSGSRIVVVGSDATGYGTGGTTGILSIGSSNDSSCYFQSGGNETAAQAAFHAYPTSVSQCEMANAMYNGALQGPITADTIIPLGTSYRTEANNTRINETDAADWYIPISWQVHVTEGTEVAFVLGDKGGAPVLVSQLMTVQPGAWDCDAIGATAGSTPTATGAASSSTPSSSTAPAPGGSSKAGPIAGGVVGGVFGTLAIAALAMVLLRMYNKRKRRAAQQAIGMTVWRHSAPVKLERGSWGKGYRDDPEEGM